MRSYLSPGQRGYYSVSHSRLPVQKRRSGLVLAAPALRLQVCPPDHRYSAGHFALRDQGGGEGYGRLQTDPGTYEKKETAEF